MKVPVPFLNTGVGGGDVLAAVIKHTGLAPEVPCRPCAERQQAMNNALQFVPWQGGGRSAGGDGGNGSSSNSGNGSNGPADGGLG